MTPSEPLSYDRGWRMGFRAGVVEVLAIELAGAVVVGGVLFVTWLCR